MNKLSLILQISADEREFKPYIENLAESFNFNSGEIILVIDAANFEAINFVKENYKQFKVFELNFGENYSMAYNYGAKCAEGEIIAFLDFGATIPKVFVQKILKAFDENQNVGVASCISSYSKSLFISKPIGFSVDDMNKRLTKKHKPNYPIVASCDGGCLCVCKELFEKLGGFDEDLQIKKYAKKDFALKMNKMGYKNILIDDLYICTKNTSDFYDIQKVRLAEKDLGNYKEKWEDFLDEWYKKYSQKNLF